MNKILKKCIEDDRAWQAAEAEKTEYLKKYNWFAVDLDNSYRDCKKFLDKIKVPYIEKDLSWGLTCDIEYESFLTIRHFHSAPKFKKYLLIDKKINIAAVNKAYNIYCKRLAKIRKAKLKQEALKLLQNLEDK